MYRMFNELMLAAIMTVGLDLESRHARKQRRTHRIEGELYAQVAKHPSHASVAHSSNRWL